MFKSNGDSFYRENVCPDGDIYWSILYLKEFFLEEAHFNAYI